MAKHWYAYTGPCPIIQTADRFAVSNYAYTTVYGTAIGLSCLGGTCPCAIYATGPAGAGAPPASPLSANVRQYITNALLLQSQYPNTTRSFVYVKN